MSTAAVQLPGDEGGGHGAGEDPGVERSPQRKICPVDINLQNAISSHYAQGGAFSKPEGEKAKRKSSRRRRRARANSQYTLSQINRQ